MIRLLLVHEVRLVADLIVAALDAEPDLTVSRWVTSTEQALPCLDSVAYDVLLVSATLPAGGALALIQTVRKSQPALKVLLVGLSECEAFVLPYLEAGVAGYVTTQDTLAALVQKIRAVARGEFPLAPAMGAALLTRLRELKQMVREFSGLQAMNSTTLYASLTARESDVLALIEQGYSNLQIGATLCIEAGTVKNHVHNLLEKLGVPTRSQAAILARQALAPQVTQRSPAVGTGGLLRPPPHRPLGYAEAAKHGTVRQHFVASAADR